MPTLVQRGAFFHAFHLTAPERRVVNCPACSRTAPGASPAPSLLPPLFDAGANQANLESARASRSVPLPSMKNHQTSVQRVADALASQASLTRTVGGAAQNKGGNPSASSWQICATAQNGVPGYLDLLDCSNGLSVPAGRWCQVRLTPVALNQVSLFRHSAAAG